MRALVHEDDGVVSVLQQQDGLGVEALRGEGEGGGEERSGGKNRISVFLPNVWRKGEVRGHTER